MLPGEGDSLVVDERGVLDGRHPRANRTLDALGRVRVGRDAQAEIARLLHGRAQFLGSEFDRSRITPMRENRARGQNLDVVRPAVCEFPDFLTHCPWAVRDGELQVPGQLDIRGEARHCAGALGYRDVGARDIHARPDDDALRNGVAHGDVIESAVGADVAHRGEPCEQGDPGIRDGIVRGDRRRSRQHLQGLGVAEVREVSMAVDEPGQHGHRRQIDDGGAGRNREVRTD